MPAAFSIAAAWRETMLVARRDLATYATVAAAFVLLPMMIASVFGPAQPVTLDGFSGLGLLIQLGLTLVGAVAQLGIARMAIIGGTVRSALLHALQVLPMLALAAVMTAFVLLPAAFLLQLSKQGQQAALLPALILVIPAIYAVGRLALSLAALSVRRMTPVAALRLSWLATAGNGWRTLGFLVLFVIALLAVTLLASGVARALATLLLLVGGKGLAAFVISLVSAAVASLYTVYSSVALAVLYRRLVG